jgi:two-component system nitrogen regulation response regulator GlnG
MRRILLIDDEPVIQHAFRKAFHAPEYAVDTARTASEGLARFAELTPDVVVLDIHLPDADKLEAYERFRKINARIPILLITGHGTTDLAIEAMKQGAFDYLIKPLRYEQLQELIDRACVSSRLMNVPAVLSDGRSSTENADALVGRSPEMQDVYKAIGRVAATDTQVLILGESGTGKELVARAIYQHSQRKDKPFLAINCGAIPETLIESELFGHEKGAFTGADRKRIGKFEQCGGGTLFLDEVGEMPLLAQVKLLRVLQEQRFERVGGTEIVETNVRVIAATNVDLEKQVAAGKFRSDLYFRLNGYSLSLPPLRERGDDLVLLTDHYLRCFSRELQRPIPVMPPETRELLRSYSWPGNVRELQSVLKRGVLTMSGAVLHPEDLTISRTVPVTANEVKAGFNLDQFIEQRLEAESRDLYGECLAQMERRLLVRVLTQTGGNQLRAAEILGITRGSLRHKLRTLGIVLEKSVWSEVEAPE